MLNFKSKKTRIYQFKFLEFIGKNQMLKGVGLK